MLMDDCTAWLEGEDEENGSFSSSSSCSGNSSSSSGFPEEETEEEDSFYTVTFYLDHSLMLLSLLSTLINCFFLLTRRKKYPLYAINIPFAILRELGTFFAVFGGLIPDSLSCLSGTLTWESDNFPFLTLLIYEEFQLYLKFRQHQQMLLLRRRRGLRHFRLLTSYTFGIFVIALSGLIFNTVTLDRLVRITPETAMSLTNGDDECWLSTGLGETVGDTIFGIVVVASISFLAILMRKVDDAFGWAPRYRRCAALIGVGIFAWQAVVLLDAVVELEDELSLRLYIVVNWFYALCMYACSWLLTVSALWHSFSYERERLASFAMKSAAFQSALVSEKLISGLQAAKILSQQVALMNGQQQKKALFSSSEAGAGARERRDDGDEAPTTAGRKPELYNILLPVSSVEELWKSLANEQIMDAFHQHLVKEFAVENGFYIMASQKYRAAQREREEEESAKWAKEILEAHLDPDSATQVNISDALRRQKIQEVKKAQATNVFLFDLFYAVDDEVLAMLLDPYRRFYYRVKGEYEAGGGGGKREGGGQGKREKKETAKTGSGAKKVKVQAASSSTNKVSPP